MVIETAVVVLEVEGEQSVESEGYEEGRFEAKASVLR